MWWRILVVVAWLGAVYGALAMGDTVPVLILGIVLTIGAGAVVGRWWVLLVPVVIGLVWAIVIVAVDADGGDADPVVYAGFAFIGALFAAFVMAVGVAASKLAQQ